jgi:hypothetical protein
MIYTNHNVAVKKMGTFLYIDTENIVWWTKKLCIQLEMMHVVVRKGVNKVHMSCQHLEFSLY